MYGFDASRSSGHQRFRSGHKPRQGRRTFSAHGVPGLNSGQHQANLVGLGFPYGRGEGFAGFSSGVPPSISQAAPIPSREASVEHNFAFTAIHRPGVKNCLPDVLSRAKKHLYRLDPEQLTPALLKEEASSLAPRSGATPTHTHSYGSFFNSDPITLAASADRLLIPSRTFLISSSSLSSLMEGVSL